MKKNIFLDENITILKNKSVISKKELCQYIELITYLAAQKEITLNDALTYSKQLMELSETSP